jgi:2-oxoglutarate ferredoxin oxidoreductase subunit delta
MSPGSGRLPAAPHFERTPMSPAPPAIHGRVLIARERCKGCELCIEFCPRDVLVRSEQFNAKGYHYPVVTRDECVNCRLCVTVCPEYAIFSVPGNDHGGHA